MINEKKDWRKDDTTEDNSCKQEKFGQQCHGHLPTQRKCTVDIRMKKLRTFTVNLMNSATLNTVTLLQKN